MGPKCFMMQVKYIYTTIAQTNQYVNRNGQYKKQRRFVRCADSSQNGRRHFYSIQWFSYFLQSACRGEEKSGLIFRTILYFNKYEMYRQYISLRQKMDRWIFQVVKEACVFSDHIYRWGKKRIEEYFKLLQKCVFLLMSKFFFYKNDDRLKAHNNKEKALAE